MSEVEQERHPKVNPPRLARCPHCGNRTPHKTRHRADYSEPEDLSGGDDVYYDERWFAILECATCAQLSLYVDFWNDGDGRWESALAYPRRLQAPPEVSEAVAIEFAQAVSAQQMAPGLVAVAIRRVFEAIALDQGAPPGSNLNLQIRWLADQGKIPPQLASMMNVSRTLGNLGAHHTDFGFTTDDVKTVIDFAMTLFEYLYVGPAKVAAFRKSVAERKS